MRAVMVNEYGGPEVLTFEDVEDPAPGPGEVLVRLRVSGLNFIDTYHRSGLYPMPTPFRAGVEGLGVVEVLGEGVKGFQVGQRVGWAAGGLGSFSELAVVSEATLVAIPDDIDDQTAVALLLQGVTAHYLATDTYPVHPGDTVLIHAAAGGVGLLLTQIAKLRGATVIGTASTPDKQAQARAAGADHALDYDGFAAAAREITGGRGVDVVFDGVGAATFDDGLASLRPRGMMVAFGNASGPVPPFDILRLSQLGSLYLTRPTAVHYTLTPEELRARTDDLFGWVRSSDLRVVPPTVYGIDDIRQAFEALESRQTTGKVVLVHA